MVVGGEIPFNFWRIESAVDAFLITETEIQQNTRNYLFKWSLSIQLQLFYSPLCQVFVIK